MGGRDGDAKGDWAAAICKCVRGGGDDVDIASRGESLMNMRLLHDYYTWILSHPDDVIAIQLRRDCHMITT